MLDGGGPPPAPTGGGWGELGICEICLHARGVDGVHRSLVAAGAESLMEPLTAAVEPNDVSLDIAYVADPWGGKLELIEWTGLWHSLPGPARAEGVNHVAFGVKDMARTRAFYEQLGFTEMLFESVDFFEPMAPWYPVRAARPAHGHAARGAGRRDRAGRARPRRARLPRRVGPHRAVRLRRRRRRASSRAWTRCAGLGVETGEPVTLDVGDGGEWRYASFRDPDELYVTLVEARY